MCLPIWEGLGDCADAQRQIGQTAFVPSIFCYNAVMFVTKLSLRGHIGPTPLGRGHTSGAQCGV
ncbi:hypothetical protein SPHV1_150012 [Novosphingobium sp. KN65.2]|nr:hypothetical protein SPHV1_150012 [Novosphingobium sp. KN65.2]